MIGILHILNQHNFSGFHVILYGISLKQYLIVRYKKIRGAKYHFAPPLLVTPMTIIILT